MHKRIEQEMQKLGIELSKKPKENRPFSTTLFALGAEFDLKGPFPRILAPAEKIDKLENLIQEMSPSEGRSVQLLNIDSFAGYIEYMCRFSQRGFLQANEAYASLRAPSRFKQHRCPVSKELMNVARRLLSEMKGRRGISLLRNPFYLHFGLGGSRQMRMVRRIKRWEDGACAYSETWHGGNGASPRGRR